MALQLSNTSAPNDSAESAMMTMPTEDTNARVIAAIQLSIIAGIGICVNSMPLTLLILDHVKRNVVNCMVANLAFAELILCLCFMFGQNFYIIWREQIPKAYCHFLSYIHFIPAFAAYVFPPYLAINRYISLYNPQLYKNLYTKRRTIGLMCGSWAAVVMVPVAFLVGGQTGYDADNYHCCLVVTSITWVIVYWVVLMLPLFVFCDGGTIFCNYKIYKKLSCHAQQASMISNVVRENKELFYFLFLDMLCPICFHTAYFVCKFIYTHRVIEFWKRFFISLYLLNSVSRGLLATFMLKPFRVGVKRLIFRSDASTVAVQIHPILNQFSDRRPSVIPVAPAISEKLE